MVNTQDLKNMAEALHNLAALGKEKLNIYESIYNTNPEPITDVEIANWLVYFTNTFPKYTFEVQEVTKYKITFNTNMPTGYNLTQSIVCGGDGEHSQVEIFIRPTLKKGSMFVTLTEDMKLKPTFST